LDTKDALRNSTHKYHQSRSQLEAQVEKVFWFLDVRALPWGTVEPLHFGNESVIGKIEYGIFLAGCGGSPATGEKEPPGQSETSPTQLPREFKTDECPHAMPEQNIWKLGLTHDEICGRRAQSRANFSPREFSANREKYREFAKF
jgi:hypothetical protein